MNADIAERDFWEMLAPSQFAQWTSAIEGFAAELKLPANGEARERDPLELLLDLNSAVYRAIEYVPKSTREIRRWTTPCGIGRAFARTMLILR